MYNALHGHYEQPYHEAAHDVGLEGLLVQFAEALVQGRLSEMQRPRLHVFHSHATVAGHFYGMVDYVVLL